MTDNRNWRGLTTINIFGRQSVADALAAAADNHLTVHDLRIRNNLPKDITSKLKQLAEPLNITPDLTTQHKVSELSHDPRHDQGVAARVTLENVTTADAFVESLKGKRAARPTRILAFDGLTNPQNIGMAVRAAAAAGTSAVLWPLKGSPWISGLIIKSSAATVFRTTIATCDTIDDGLDTLRTRGFTIAALDGTANDSLWQHTPDHNACYVLGSETRGISEHTRDTADQLLRIPIAPGVESLNAATAAAVLCFHVARLDHDPTPATLHP